MNWKVIQADVMDGLEQLDDKSIQCVMTSPPYWGLRDYGMKGQIGLEKTPENFINKMVMIFREVRRAMRKDGTLWLNMGDCYAQTNRKEGGHDFVSGGKKRLSKLKGTQWASGLKHGLKQKDLIGMPWRLAFALQADGWYLRSDIIWSKPNPLPESVKDRPTKSHEYLFLLAKSKKYYFDQDAVREKYIWPDGPNSPGSIKSPYGQGFTRNAKQVAGWAKDGNHSAIAHNRPKSHRGSKFNTGKTGINQHGNGKTPRTDHPDGRNIRSVWNIATQPYHEAHFATFPQKLVEPCIKAGSREGDMILDPFCGSGTTGYVALKLMRNFVGIELNPEYVKLSRKRIGNSMPMFAKEVIK